MSALAWQLHPHGFDVVNTGEEAVRVPPLSVSAGRNQEPIWVAVRRAGETTLLYHTAIAPYRAEPFLPDDPGTHIWLLPHARLEVTITPPGTEWTLPYWLDLDDDFWSVLTEH